MLSRVVDEQALTEQALTEQALTEQALTEQALIAEARAHARRRRRRIALAVIVAAATAVAAVLVAHTASGGGHAAAGRQRDVPPAPAGIVTGQLSVCMGAALPPGHPLPVTPGTVTAVRGTVSWKHSGPGTWQMIYPKGPAMAEQYIGNNYHQTFRFTLPPGRYVLFGRYADGQYPNGTFGTYATVSVTAGHVVRANLPDLCM
jgi:hypothetical protein